MNIPKEALEQIDGNIEIASDYFKELSIVWMDSIRAMKAKGQQAQHNFFIWSGMVFVARIEERNLNDVVVEYVGPVLNQEMNKGN